MPSLIFQHLCLYQREQYCPRQQGLQRQGQDWKQLLSDLPKTLRNKHVNGKRTQCQELEQQTRHKQDMSIYTQNIKSKRETFFRNIEITTQKKRRLYKFSLKKSRHKNSVVIYTGSKIYDKCFHSQSILDYLVKIQM